MRKKNRPRLHTSIGYYGFGNISAVFNRRPKPIFEKFKTIYGEELERYSLTNRKNHLRSNNISKAALEDMLNTIRLRTIEANRKAHLFKGLLLALIALAIIVGYNML